MYIIISTFIYLITFSLMVVYSLLLPVIEAVLLFMENVMFSEAVCRADFEFIIRLTSIASKKETPEERRKEAKGVLEKMQGTLEQRFEKARINRIKCHCKREHLINIWREEKRYLASQGKYILSCITREMITSNKKKQVFFLPLDKTNIFWDETMGFLSKECFGFYSIQAIWMDEYHIYWMTLKVLNPKIPEQDHLLELIKGYLLRNLENHPGLISIPGNYWNEHMLYCSLKENFLVLGIAASEYGKDKLLTLKEKDVQKMAKELTEDL